MSASEKSEVVAKLRRCTSLPEWAQLPLTMDEVRVLILMADTLTDLREHDKLRARLICEKNAEIKRLSGQLERAADDVRTVLAQPTTHRHSVPWRGDLTGADCDQCAARARLKAIFTDQDGGS